MAGAGTLLRANAWSDSEPAAQPLGRAALTSYEIDQQLDLDEQTIRATLVVDFPNPATEPLQTIPLLLHANSSRELGASEAHSPWLDVTAVAVSGPERNAKPLEGDWVNPTTTDSPAASPPAASPPAASPPAASPPAASPPAADQPTTRARARRIRPTLLMVDLPAPIAPGAQVRLHVRYVAHLRQLLGSPNDMFAQSLGALGSLGPNAEPQDYGLLATGDGLLTAAFAYPVVAPYRNGAFDTGAPAAFGDVAYGAVARFAVRTVLPDGLTAVTNLIDVAAPREDAAAAVLCSAGEFVRDFVLVAGADLAHRSVQHGPVRVTSVYRAGDAKAGGDVLDAAVSALGAFERHFGPYPYSELDVVESSLVGGAGGVEFSGMVLIAGMLYRSPDESSHPLALLGRLSRSVGSGLDGLFGLGSLLDPGGSPPAAPSEPRASATEPSLRLAPDAGPPALPPEPSEWVNQQLVQLREFTVAHEVAHQYFAGIVGNDTRRHPSLDEPLAQYAARVAMEARYGPAVGQTAWNANVTMNYAVYRLLGGVDRPVLRDTAQFGSAVEYAALVYGKAPQLYVVLRDTIGEEALHTTIRAALSRHRFGLLTTEEWIAAIEQGTTAGRRSVRPVFRRWLEQAHADADLGIDASGDRLLDLAFGPEQASALREAFATLGMSPRELFRLAAGGALGPG